MTLINRIDLREIIKYVFSAGTAFVIDIALFSFFNALLNPIIGDMAIIVATVAARVISSLYNYYVNSRYVFGNFDRTSIFKYYALVIVQMIVSAGSVYILNTIFTRINDTAIKIAVDVVLFCVNYMIQKSIIFRKNENSVKDE